jgi:hypothetical protein
VFSEIAEQLYDADSFDDVLLQIAEAAVSRRRRLPHGERHAVERRRYRTAASTDPAATAVDQAQYQSAPGGIAVRPRCWPTSTTGRVVPAGSFRPHGPPAPTENRLLDIHQRRGLDQVHLHRSTPACRSARPFDPNRDQRSDTLSEILKQRALSATPAIDCIQASCPVAQQMSVGFEVNLGANLFQICDCLLLKSCESDHLDPSQPGSSRCDTSSRSCSKSSPAADDLGPAVVYGDQAEDHIGGPFRARSDLAAIGATRP